MNGNQTYCSPECYKAGNRVRAKKRGREVCEHKLSEYRTCQRCGKTYLPYNGFQKYCSKECASISGKEIRKAYFKSHREEILIKQREKDRRKRAEERAMRERPVNIHSDNIDRTVAAAEAAGLSYGQYVIRQRMEAQKKSRP